MHFPRPHMANAITHMQFIMKVANVTHKRHHVRIELSNLLSEKLTLKMYQQVIIFLTNTKSPTICFSRMRTAVCLCLKRGFKVQPVCPHGQIVLGRALYHADEQVEGAVAPC